jgi:predicted alpha-1,2-mannosidase
MTRRPRRRYAYAAVAAALLFAPILIAQAGPASAATLNLTQFVNPFIGTDDSNSPNPVGGGAGGSTVPGPVLPFGMVQFSPDTPTASPSGYRFSDTQIQEYSLTHFNGAGCPNNEDINILPITGSLGVSPGSSWTSYQATQTKSSEAAQAGYYKAVESTYGNTMVELTATTRTGRMRLTYPSSTTARVLVNVSRSATGSRNGSISISGSTITGSHTAGGFCGSSNTFQMFFAMQFDRTPTGQGTFNGSTISNGSGSASGSATGGFVTFDTTSNPVVNVKVAISFVSVANAQANLAAEASGFDFDATRSAADTAWNTILNRVQATGGSATDTQKFYTALYHVLQNPNIASDSNGQYMGFDSAVHTASHPVYQNYSGWDIYRSWAALVAWIAPTEAADIAKSMVLDGQQGGLLPKWSHQNHENFIMTGDPGPIIVSSMNAFGITDFDRTAALNLMESSSNGGTMQGNPIRGRQSDLVSHQFMPDESSDGLEYVTSDFAVAQYAERQGRNDIRDTHMVRAQWWRNMFNDQTSFITTRHSDGSWAVPLDPASDANFTEGNASQYTWMVTYNFQSLVNLMGGRQTATQRLDHHFQNLNGGLTAPFFYIGNEPEHGVPWAYNFARKPAGTSAAVRRVMNESFTTGAGGLPGNEDLGATSAWYVWAALGMYPATPGADTLALHGPIFPSVLIQRPGGDVQINGTGAGQGAQFVQNFSLNGTATTHNFIRYRDIAAGGTLTFTMGSSANSSWGTGSGDVPPSFNQGFTPPPTAPDFGANLAQGKTVTSPQASCAAGEDPAKLTDGMIVNNSKFCTLTSPSSFTVDLGSSQTVSTFVVKHAGLGAENTGWNSGAYTIQTSTDGTTFSTAVNVSGNTSSRTVHSVSARTARFVRMNISTPTNNGNNPNAATRIYEFEVYGSGSPPPGNNIALNQPATGSTSCNSNETPAKAFNGSISGGLSDKFCSGATTKFLQVDLGAVSTITQFNVFHAGAGGESTSFNTRDFDLLVSNDGTTFSTVVQARANTANVTNHPVTASGRFVRMNIINGEQSGTNGTARIYELEVIGTRGTGPTNVALNKPATGSTPCASTEGPEKAFNGSVSGGNSDKWCSLQSMPFLQVDLGATTSIVSFTVRHAGAGGESTSFNTRDFDIAVSGDGTNFATVVQVRGNTASVTNHAMAATGRFVRLNVITPTQGSDTAARIYELEVYA